MSFVRSGYVYGGTGSLGYGGLSGLYWSLSPFPSWTAAYDHDVGDSVVVAAAHSNIVLGF